MKKKTPARRRSNRSKNHDSSVPTQLAALLALLDENAGHQDADEMSRALAAARSALRDPLRGGSWDAKDAVWGFIISEAERGAWKELNAKIHKLTRPEDSDFNATTGDFHNLYGGPGFAMGIAVAYVFLREGGAL
jgi:hypothetical protein